VPKENKQTNDEYKYYGTPIAPVRAVGAVAPVLLLVELLELELELQVIIINKNYCNFKISTRNTKDAQSNELVVVVVVVVVVVLLCILIIELQQ